MNLSGPFILRPIATSLLMVAILFAGIFAYRLLPVSALPEVEYPTIRVSTFYPSASPEVMTTLITAPLERQFGQMPGLNQMTSSSSSGASVITLQFTLDISLDIAEQQVQAAINGAGGFLPNDLPNPPIYSKVNPADAPVLTLALSSAQLPLNQIEDLAETRLVQKISQVSGVGLVSISGGQRPAIRIQVNSTVLAAYGLMLEDVRTVITNANVNQPKGSFDGPHLSYVINTNDQLSTVQDFKELIISYKNGNPIHLKNVAQVVYDVENVRQAAWMKDTPAVILNIQRQSGANVIEVVDRIKSLLPQLTANLPADLKVDTLVDRTTLIRASVREAQYELLISIALVVVVIYVFLGNFLATIIPSISVPLSLIGTFSLMYCSGFSLNNLTIMALIIATGFVVDDAIVIIENISRYREEGANALEAALKGSKQIGFTILSLTLSLIAALIPLLFMDDIVGRLFREFAVTLAFTILLSAFVSLTLTPMMCFKLFKAATTSRKSAFNVKAELFQDRVTAFYGQTLRWVLDHRPVVMIVMAATLFFTGVLSLYIPKGFFPSQDSGIIQGFSEASQTVSFKSMIKRQKILAQAVMEDSAVETLSSFIGIDGTNTTMNTGRLQIILKDREKRSETIQQVIDRLQKRLEKVQGIKLYMQAVQDISMDDRTTRTQYQYSVMGPHSKLVDTSTQQLIQYLEKSPSMREVVSDIQNAGLQTMIQVDRMMASRLGITPLLIDNALYNAFGQRQVSTIFTQFNQYRVVLETLPAFQEPEKGLDKVYLNTAGSGLTNLKTFTTVSQIPGPLVINRQDQFPAATISFNIAPGYALGDAISVFENANQQLKLSDQIQTKFEGIAQIFLVSKSSQGWLIVIAIGVIYIILGMLYESYIHPLTILSTLPSASFGALLALVIFKYELSIVALIGIMLLIGIVMKNAILMIDFALELERLENKKSFDAIYQACLLRFRPIIMTTLTAMLGAVPLAFGTGTGSEFRHPLGISIIGGLFFSQILTLYTTPVIYLAFDKMAVNIKIAFSKKPAPAERL